MIKIIKIIERDAIEKGVFLGEVVFPSENVYAVTVKDPFQEPGEGRRRKKGTGEIFKKIGTN